MNKTAIRTLLIDLGITGVVSTRKLAETLNLAKRTIASEKLKGHIRQIDRNTYELEDIVEWLHRYPRYLIGLETKEVTHA